MYNQCKEAYRAAERLRAQINVPLLGTLQLATPDISNTSDAVTNSSTSQQKTQPKSQKAQRKGRANSPFTDDMEALRRFATARNTSLWLKAEARRLGLIITQAGRRRRRGDRVGFGLSTKVRVAIEPNLPSKFERNLFKFGLRKDGLLYPSESSINLRVLQSILATCFTCPQNGRYRQ